MLRIFEAIKKSPFSGANLYFCSFPENASAEIKANACLNIDIRNKQQTTPQHKIASQTIFSITIKNYFLTHRCSIL